MSSKQVNDLKLIISHFVRSNYEDKYNQPHVPMALKCLILKFSNMIIGCKLLSIQQDLDLFNLLKNETSNIKKINLLMIASDHDYSPEKFHELCDDKGATLTIIESNHGNIFGGYTSKSWHKTIPSWSTKSMEWIKDGKAFLFLIKSNHQSIQNKCPLIFKVKPDKSAIIHNCEFGPIFGFHDITIKDNCSGLTKQRHYDYDQFEKLTLCGGPDHGGFKVVEYQVFQITIKT